MILERLSMATVLCLAWASTFAQGVCGHPKAERLLMREAEVEIDGFFCDSVMTEYPIYTDAEHKKLDAVLVKTSDNAVWYLSEKGENKDGISFEKNSENDIKIFNFLDSIKPDKTYIQSGIIIAEKDGKKSKMRSEK
jgi:hypothetical protein